jgi:penicillin-binding protein 1A
MNLFCSAKDFEFLNRFPIRGFPSNLKDAVSRLPQVSAATSHDGIVLGAVYVENRLCADSKSIGADLKSAVLSTEDKRFLTHHGVDWIAVARTIWKNLKAGRIVQGGSTITQQLVRNVILRNARRTFARKFLEVCLALALEKTLSKQQILHAYLNASYFGHGIYGVRLAALYYFSKEVEELTIEDCAYLAGLLKGPRHFCHCCKVERSKNRTKFVLRRMVQEGHSIRDIPHSQPPRRFRRRKTIDAMCPSTAPYFLDFVGQWLRRCSAAHFPSRPLVIRTSLNIGCQEVLEKVCRDVEQDGFKGRLACIVQDSKSGLVRALAGGYNFSNQPFNVAVNGSIQPGSTFKPFVLAAALKSGMSPDKRYISQPLELQLPNRQVWRVGNFQRVYRGEISIAEATVFSDNSVYAQLMLDLGTDSVSRLLRRVGLDIGPVSPAAAIGAVTRGCSPLQVCSGYSLFSAEGLFMPSSPVVGLQSESGDVLLQHVNTFQPVLKPSTAMTVNHILRQVVVRGTGPLRMDAEDIHAKTGTTHDGAWYVSFDQAFRVLTWIERTDDDPTPNYSEKGVTAINLAQRIWSLLRRGTFTSPQLFGLFRGTDCLTVRDLLWVEEQFA